MYVRTYIIINRNNMYVAVCRKTLCKHYVK